MTEDFDNDRRRTGLMLVTAVMLGAFLFSTVGYRLLRDKMKKPAPSADATADIAAFSRIVSLAPSTTETLYALGLGDRIVGVTDFCNYPPEARDKTRVGALLRPHSSWRYRFCRASTRPRRGNRREL
jgi:ABC-type hemin transport system substrate-binding protein